MQKVRMWRGAVFLVVAMGLLTRYTITDSSLAEWCCKTRAMAATSQTLSETYETAA
jgi:hypothetical protein